MAGPKLRKEKHNTTNNKNNDGNHESNYVFYPDSEAMKRKDNEIHFLRLVCLVAILTAFFILAYHRYKISYLEGLLKTKDAEYIGALTGGVIMTGEDKSVYVMMMDQFVSLIYITVILVVVVLWW